MRHATLHWWGQRLTAVALILLGLWFLVSILSLDDLQYAQVSAWAAERFNNSLLILTMAILAYHSKLGVQVVIEDYVHGPKISRLSLVLNNVAHVIVVAAGFFALLAIGYGST